MTALTEVAARYACVAASNIATEFPHATQHVVRRRGEVSRPRELHLAFHGSYDWHSCVHMHWLLVRLLGELPDVVDPDQIRDTLDATLTDPRSRPRRRTCGRTPRSNVRTAGPGRSPWPPRARPARTPPRGRGRRR